MRLECLIWISAGVAIAGSNVAEGLPPQPVVGEKMLLAGGDCLDDEILAWQRLRAERRVAVALDDTPPMMCRNAAGKIFLATGSGRFLTSTNEGLSFQSGGDGISLAPPTDIMVEERKVTGVQALGVLKSGRLLLVYGDHGRLKVARSADGGWVWRPGGDLSAAGYSRLQAGGVRITQLTDGTVLLAVAAWKGASDDPEGLVFASRDEGATWSVLGSLGLRSAGANLLQLKSGELLAAITYRGGRKAGGPGSDIGREELFHNVVLARSTDGGKTWRDYRCVTRFKEAPGELSELSDGTVVLTYGQQNSPFGARAILSRDGGKTWSSRVYILGFSTVRAEWYSGAAFRTAPGWRVSTVALKDDSILTVYTRGSLVLTQAMWKQPGVSEWYQKNRTPGEKGKAVLSVRWTLDGMKKPPLGVPAGMTAIATPNADGYIDNGWRRINPEHLNEGGDYFHDDEILAYRRVAAEHHMIGPADRPTLALDPEGHPVVAGVHGEIYRSTDSGRRWTLTGRVPAGNIQAFGILRDGVMLAGSNKQTPGMARVQVLRSEDRGQTWSEPTVVDPAPFDTMGFGNCIRIRQMPDGTAMMTSGNLWHSKLKISEQDGIFRSRDGGKTWGDFTSLRLGCESNVLRLASGRMLAAIRDQGPWASPYDFIFPNTASLNDRYRVDFIKNISLAASDDNGYTWSRPWTVTRYNECPADLVEMPDGAIVLTYMQKNRPDSARAMVSRDGGKTWDSTLYMLGLLGWKSKGAGHTSSVLLKDGRVLTVGSGWSEESNSNLAEAIIWKPVDR
jgi:hypothetical protein